MFVVLLVLGVALLVFGGVVLLRHSDKPGGTIKMLGVELTSAGAGLPLIALGVLCVVLGVQRAPDGWPRRTAGGTRETTSAAADTSLGCVTSIFTNVAPERIASIETGMRDVEVLGSNQPLDTPFGLVLTENGRRIAALRLRLYRAPNASADLYRVESAVDAACRPIAQIRNQSRGGDPTALINFDTARLRVDAHDYDLRIGGEGNVVVGYFTRLP